MTILPRVNGTPGFGFAEAITRDDGLVERSGALEFRPSRAAELFALIDRGEPLTYTGPVSVDGVWVEQSFPVIMRPAAPATESCVKFSMQSVTEAPLARSDVAA